MEYGPWSLIAVDALRNSSCTDAKALENRKFNTNVHAFSPEFSAYAASNSVRLLRITSENVEFLSSGHGHVHGHGHGHNHSKHNNSGKKYNISPRDCKLNQNSAGFSVSSMHSSVNGSPPTVSPLWTDVVPNEKKAKPTKNGWKTLNNQVIDESNV